MTRERAEEIAILALAWLANDPDLLGTFLGSTGLAAQDLPAMAGETEFLSSVLDFLLMDDAWVLGCAGVNDIAPTDLSRARGVLVGAEMHWT
jgi:hypothetical protein